MKRDFFDLLLMYNGRSFLIIGAGATTRKYQKEISKYIERVNPITIGINNICEFFKPDFHLFTNNKRWEDYGKNVDKRSILMIGSHIKNPPQKRNYILVKYSDKKTDKGFYIQGGSKEIRGYYRTAGCLAIILADLMGAREIAIAGMDGYTLKLDGDQHCYGHGMTDGNTEEYCKEKDEIINDVLTRLYQVRQFKIITPTIYKDFYVKAW